MNRAEQQNAYLTAFEAANSELSELLATYKQLQIRKEQLEEAAEALEFFFQSEKQVVVGVQKAPISSVRPKDETSGSGLHRIDRLVEPSPLPFISIRVEPSDPIQRRINDALGIAAVA